MPKTYVGYGGIAQRCRHIYVGDSSNIARKCKKIYVGDSNNIARLAFCDIPTTLVLDGAGGQDYSFTYNGATYSGYIPANSYDKTITIDMVETSKSITFNTSYYGSGFSYTITAGQSNTVKLYPASTVFWYGRAIKTIYSHQLYDSQAPTSYGIYGDTIRFQGEYNPHSSNSGYVIYFPVDYGASVRVRCYGSSGGDISNARLRSAFATSTYNVDYDYMFSHYHSVYTSSSVYSYSNSLAGAYGFFGIGDRYDGHIGSEYGKESLYIQAIY